MSSGGKTFDAVGWRVTVQPGAGEIRLEHEATGSVYVLDEHGGLRVPGSAAADVDPEAVQAALGDALEAAGRARRVSDADNGRERAIPDGGQAQGCAVECDETTGEVTIESDTKISLDAPTVDIDAEDISLDARRFIDIASTSDLTVESQRNISLDAKSAVDIASATTNVTSSAVLTLKGALVKVN